MRETFTQILAIYRQARTNDRRTSDHPAHQCFVRLKEELRTILDTSSKALSIKSSTGMGNWAKVPWVAFLDHREAPTMQAGVYCAYLFREDMTGLYLALTQGVSAVRERNSYIEARRILAERADSLRQQA